MIQRAVHVLAALGVATVFSASMHACFRGHRSMFPGGARYPAQPPLMRICVAEGVASCSVQCDGPVKLLDGAAVVGRHASLAPTAIAANASGIAVGDKLCIGPITIEAEGNAPIGLDGKGYRGTLRIERNANGGTLDAINQLDLEEYLRGVVGCEVRSSWPAAAVEAQAVAARSYALKQWMRRRGGRFDLRATTADQVYGGLAGESRRVTAAVDRTRGAVLEYNGQPLAGFYSACCGGHTASAAALGEQVIAPLKGVPCGFCDPARHVSGTGTPGHIYHWQVRLNKRGLAEELRKKGFVVDAVETVTGLDVDASGRPARVEVKANSSAPAIMTASEFRGLAGYSLIKSTRLVFHDAGEEVDVEGFGWGHGVGLCQWGAKGMADAGYGFEAILEHYYPGAEIRRIY